MSARTVTVARRAQVLALSELSRRHRKEFEELKRDYRAELRAGRGWARPDQAYGRGTT